MGNSYYLDRTFKNLKSLDPGDYENCEFLQCDFSNYSFKEINFIDCRDRKSTRLNSSHR
ncbi:MAG: hypothetical protein RIR51_1477, partial [Bacteroidota bacterium]